MRIPAALLAAMTLGLSPALFAQTPPPAEAAEQTQDAGSFAQPAIVSPSWSLDLVLGTPKTLSAENYNGDLRWYWYAPYKVTNLTNDERLFAPQVIITNDRGDIIQAGVGVPPTVFNVVREKLANPLLESPEAVVGQLLQGPDFARESVIIWPVSASDVDRFTIFFGGVDGETQPMVSPSTGQVVTRPATDPLTGQTQLDAEGNLVQEPVRVRRTRAFDYVSPGTHDRPQAQPVELLRQYEVMR